MLNGFQGGLSGDPRKGGQLSGWLYRLLGLAVNGGTGGTTRMQVAVSPKADAKTDGIGNL